MFFRNALYYGSDFRFHKGGFEVEHGRFVAVGEVSQGEDLHDAYVIPGLVDIHTHGNSGEDFSNGDYDGLKKLAAYLASHGITSFSPASMALPENTLKKVFETAVRLRNEMPHGCARIRGITMEGPFLSEAKKGAQCAVFLKAPDYEMFKRLNKSAEGMIKIVCVAPELKGALDFIEKAAKDAVVSAAHTGADYTTASSGFYAGITHITHLFNAMPPLLHRAPGIIGAAAERANVTAELICDGIHVHESAVRAAFSLFTAERICLISDSVSACGMPGGQYKLGGQDYFIRNGRAELADGTFAGSVATLFDCMKNAVRFGIKLDDAVRCATYNPARRLGIETETGTIFEGKSADFIICDKKLNLVSVYLCGERIV